MDVLKGIAEETRALLLKRVVDRYFDEISQYVVQLWLILSEEPLQFRPHASAVLVEMNGRKYLLTAGHVLDDIDLKYRKHPTPF